MTITQPWIVRPHAPGDEERVTELFESVFGKPMTLEHYKWKLFDTPLRIDAPTAWLAESDNRIIGHYAGSPMRFKLAGDIVKALHGCDVMTAPDFRRQGVLTALGTAAADVWTNAGVKLVTGLHYGGWGSRRHFLGWREQFRAVHLWRPLRFERIVGRFLPLPRLGERMLMALGRVWRNVSTRSPRATADDINITPISHPGSEFDRLWDLLGDSYESLVVRDRAWVTYRYSEAPHANYRIMLARRGPDPVGYVVYRIHEHDGQLSGFIVDLFTSPHDESGRMALLRTVFNELEEAGAAAVRAFVSAETPLLSEFRRLGFWRKKGHFDVSIIPLDPNADYTSLSDPGRWFAMPGDFDVW